MKLLFAAAILALMSLVTLPTLADGTKTREIKGPIDESRWVLVKPPLKPGKYTLRVDRYVSEDVGCEYEECGCLQSDVSCGAGEICVGLGICVPEASGIRGPEVPTYLYR